jgi:hypothetical protein
MKAWEDGKIKALQAVKTRKNFSCSAITVQRSQKTLSSVKN